MNLTIDDEDQSYAVEHYAAHEHSANDKQYVLYTFNLLIS